jgi:hypothetical protein
MGLHYLLRDPFLFICSWCPYFKETQLWAPAAGYWDSFTCLYVHDVQTSQKTCLCASTACYEDSFTFLYVDDVCTSQETHLWVSIACYGDSFTFLYVNDVRTSEETPMGFHGLLWESLYFRLTDNGSQWEVLKCVFLGFSEGNFDTTMGNVDVVCETFVCAVFNFSHILRALQSLFVSGTFHFSDVEVWTWRLRPAYWML